MTERIQVAVVGCGMIAQSTHLPIIQRSERIQLHTCCDISEKALAVCQERFRPKRVATDWRDVVRDPEVGVICLAAQERLRLPVIRAAAEAGKPVYCEKPMAASMEEAREIQAVVKSSGIPFCVGHNRRASPAMREAWRIFRSHMASPRVCPWRFDREEERRPRLSLDGVAGMSVRINDDWYSWKGWVFDKQLAPYGPMLFEMTHFTDICNWFLQAEPEEVVALESDLMNEGVVIKYRTGEMATISMSANGTFGYPKELYEVFGKGAAVIVDHMLEVRTAGISNAPPRIVYPIKNDHFPETGAEGGLAGWLAKNRAAAEKAGADGHMYLALLPQADKGHAQMWELFVEEILGKGPPVSGVDDAVQATRVALAAVRASRERRAVRVDEI